MNNDARQYKGFIKIPVMVTATSALTADSQLKEAGIRVQLDSTTLVVRDTTSLPIRQVYIPGKKVTLTDGEESRLFSFWRNRKP